MPFQDLVVTEERLAEEKVEREKERRLRRLREKQRKKEEEYQRKEREESYRRREKQNEKLRKLKEEQRKKHLKILKEHRKEGLAEQKRKEYLQRKKRQIKKYLHDSLGLFKTVEEKEHEKERKYRERLNRQKRKEQKKLEELKLKQKEKLIREKEKLEKEIQKKQLTKKRKEFAALQRKRKLRAFLHDKFGLFKTREEIERSRLERKQHRIELEHKLEDTVLRSLASRLERKRLSPEEEIRILMQLEQKALQKRDELKREPLTSFGRIRKVEANAPVPKKVAQGIGHFALRSAELVGKSVVAAINGAPKNAFNDIQVTDKGLKTIAPFSRITSAEPIPPEKLGGGYIISVNPPKWLDKTYGWFAAQFRVFCCILPELFCAAQPPQSPLSLTP